MSEGHLFSLDEFLESLRSGQVEAAREELKWFYGRGILNLHSKSISSGNQYVLKLQFHEEEEKVFGWSPLPILFFSSNQLSQKQTIRHIFFRRFKFLPDFSWKSKSHFTKKIAKTKQSDMVKLLCQILRDDNSVIHLDLSSNELPEAAFNFIAELIK